MTKKTRNTRATSLENNRGKGVAIEHHECIDDNPDPLLLSQLKEVDPRLIDLWIDSFKKEQDFRHSDIKTQRDIEIQKLSITTNVSKMYFRIDLTSILTAFIILIIGMFLSFFLISNNHITLGSIFGGSTLLLCVYAFLNFRKRNSVTTKKTG